MYITVQFKINIVFFIVPNLVIFLHSFSTIVTERLHQQHHFQAFISYARHLVHGMADCHLHSQAIITWVLLFGQSWKSAKPGQIDSAFLFTPPVRWHWQGKLMRAFKVACHSNVWLQFLIRAARKLSRAFTLYVELGRAKNINSEEMNVTTVLGWPLTWTLILLVKPSISDDSHSKKKHKRRFLRKKTCYGGYLGLFSPVRKSSERLESSLNMSVFFPKCGIRGRRKQALPFYQGSA